MRVFLAVTFLAISTSLGWGQADPKSIQAENEEFLKVGTRSVKAARVLVRGKPSACSFMISSTAQDAVYMNGGFVMLSGIVGVVIEQGALLVRLGTTLYDINAVTFRATPTVVEESNFLVGDKSSKKYLVSKGLAYPLGTLDERFTFDGAFELLSDALTKEKLTIAYSRKPNGGEVLVPIDLKIEKTNPDGAKIVSAKAIGEFRTCIEELVKLIK